MLREDADYARKLEQLTPFNSITNRHLLRSVADRAVYRLLGLVRRYGAALGDTACGTSLVMDVVSVVEVAGIGSDRLIQLSWPRPGAHTNCDFAK